MEKDLQTKINNDLRELGWGFYHREKGARHRSKTHNSFKYKNEKATWSDLLIFPGNCYAFFVEIKYLNGRASEEQKVFQQWAMDMRYHCYVVKNWEEWELVKRIEKINYHENNKE